MELVEWNEVDDLLLSLAEKIAKEFKPTMIAAIPRGGWTVAALLAQHLGVKEVIGIAQMKNKDERKTYISTPRNLLGESVLVVEDSIETGLSLLDAATEIEVMGAKVKTTAIFVSPKHSDYVPDYYLSIREIPEFPWDTGRQIVEEIE